jgi:hypothetical protein
MSTFVYGMLTTRCETSPRGTRNRSHPPGVNAFVDALAALLPFAFVGWTMLQKATAFDAMAPRRSALSRLAVAVIGAIVLGAATALAYQADQKLAVIDSRGQHESSQDLRIGTWTALLAGGQAGLVVLHGNSLNR